MCVRPLYVKRRWLAHGRPAPTQDDLAVLADDLIEGWYVPCGKCHECVKRRKNDWFVRTVKELTFSRQKRGCKFKNVFMLTLTFNEEHLPSTRADLSRFIRRFKDNVRKALGYFPKHFLVAERGVDENYSKRIHLHGIIIMRDFTRFETIRNAWKGGYSWIEPLEDIKGVSYSLKYMLKALYERYQTKDELVGLVFCSLGWGSSYFNKENFAFIFGNSLYSYRNIIRLAEANGFFYAMPRYFVRKACEYYGVKKYACYDDWLKQFESPPPDWSQSQVNKKMASLYVTLKKTFNPNIRKYLATV